MLRNYQQQAARFAIATSAPYLALEVGLGKTLTSLAIINRLQVPTLVVAPKLVVTLAWPEEIEKWLPNLNYSVISGTAVQRDKATTADADLHLISYDNLVWLIKHHEWRWDLVILDEISKMKSNGVRTKAFKKVHPKKVIGLSGTPAANSYLSLFYQYLALDKGATFGTSVTRFRERFFVNRGYNYPDWQIQHEAALLDYIKSSMLTMRAKDYLTELPKTVTTNYYFDLSPSGREQYEQMADNSVITDFDILAGSAAVQSNKLRQLVSGFIYDDEGEAHFNSKDKLETFASLLSEIGDEQVLVFYGFKAEAVRLKQWAVPLDSHTINEWNYGRERCMMAHPASAGHGLNLQKSGAHHIVMFSLPWDAELYLQSIGRLLRSGNTAQTIFVHHLIAKDTIDTRVVKTLNDKLNQHNRLMGGNK